MLQLPLQLFCHVLFSGNYLHTSAHALNVYSAILHFNGSLHHSFCLGSCFSAYRSCFQNFLYGWWLLLHVKFIQTMFLFPFILLLNIPRFCSNSLGRCLFLWLSSTYNHFAFLFSHFPIHSKQPVPLLHVHDSKMLRESANSRKQHSLANSRFF